jgi:hypothetical protein
LLDATVDRTPLPAGPQVISCGREPMEVGQVEWVGHAATRIAEKRFLYPTRQRALGT